MTGPAIARAKPIDPWNNYLARQELKYWEAASAEWLPWTGRTDVTVRFSEEATGYTDEGISSTLPGLGPFAMAEAAGEEGTYYYEVPALALQDGGLRDLVGSTIYMIVEGDPGASGTFTLCVSLPLRVTQPRYVT